MLSHRLLHGCLHRTGPKLAAVCELSTALQVLAPAFGTWQKFAAALQRLTRSQSPAGPWFLPAGQCQAGRSRSEGRFAERGGAGE